jgi:hypothetical protein
LAARPRAAYDRGVRGCWLATAALAAGCATRSPARPADDAPQPPSERVRHYTLWLGGARIGRATETETWSQAGVTLRRDEDLRFARGDAVVELRTTVAIDADLGLSPRRVTWTERGETARAESAYRDAAGWHASTGGALPADAIPGELAELVVRRDGRFAGAVFLPARGFATGAGRIDAVAPGRLVARLALDAGAVAEATIDVAADGAPQRVIDGDGVIELRATAEAAAAAFPIVDLLAATALPIASAAGGDGDRRALELDADLALPALPGQRVSRGVTGAVEVRLGAELPGALPAGQPGADRDADIAALVDAVRARVAPDLAAGPATAGEAAAATAGDCTTFALAYASLATGAGIATKVVTGLRVDGDRLVRHRWAVSWNGRAWVAVDVAFGAVPAGGDLVGLAVSDASDAGLVAGDGALAHVHAARWTR